MGHIHFYGQSQYLFGDLGPVVAWPLIMSSTVSRTTQRLLSELFLAERIVLS